MKARLIYKDKIIYPDGSIMELVLWHLPENTQERPHGIKYRLYYGNAQGKCLVRYDKEQGKGDHKHLSDHEIPYHFVDVDKLIKDFYDDVQLHRPLEENVHETPSDN